MRRAAVVASQFVIDLLVLITAFVLAFFIRHDGVPPLEAVGRLLLTGPYVVTGEYLILVAFAVPRLSWRYVSLRDVRTIFLATVTASVVLFAVRLVLGELAPAYPVLRHGIISFGVLAGNFALAFLGVAGVRVLRRMLGEGFETGRITRARGKQEQIPTMLIGAGQCGVLMAKELTSRPDLGLLPVGFLDDDTTKHRTVVNGVPVLGSIADLPQQCQERGARQVLVTIASASGKKIREIVEVCDRAGLPVKIIPGLYELADAAVSVSRIRDVAIEDLLGRDAVELDLASIREIVRGRVVLVTGAGGSIGSELCRQILPFEPEALLLVEQAENALFQIHRELLQREARTQLIPLIADVTDELRVDAIFAQHRPALVLHAAAHKHVPMMEWNPGEALKNNVIGTATVAEVAHRHHAERFVLISTDKAVNPTSVMGASKRVAEMYVQALAAKSDTRYATVRFGNVLGSAGSVVPIFREQIEKGGPVTVTDPEMRRYFMTIPEACQLVLQASALGEGGEVFVLDMGEPVKIVDLARDLIRLSGLREGEDIEIQFTGMRPGEKLFEEIATDAEKADATAHPKIFVGRVRRPEHEVVTRWLPEIRELTKHSDARAAVGFLRRTVPEMIREDDAPAPVPTLTPPAPDVTSERIVVTGERPEVEVPTVSRTGRKRIDTGSRAVVAEAIK